MADASAVKDEKYDELHGLIKEQWAWVNRLEERVKGYQLEALSESTRVGELCEMMVDHLTLHGGTRLALSKGVMAYIHGQVEGHERLYHERGAAECSSSPESSAKPEGASGD